MNCDIPIIESGNCEQQLVVIEEEALVRRKHWSSTLPEKTRKHSILIIR